MYYSISYEGSVNRKLYIENCDNGNNDCAITSWNDNGVGRHQRARYTVDRRFAKLLSLRTI